MNCGKIGFGGFATVWKVKLKPGVRNPHDGDDADEEAATTAIPGTTQKAEKPSTEQNYFALKIEPSGVEMKSGICRLRNELHFMKSVAKLCPRHIPLILEHGFGEGGGVDKEHDRSPSVSPERGSPRGEGRQQVGHTRFFSFFNYHSHLSMCCVSTLTHL